MRSSQKVNQWHFGRKTHICVDADYGLGPTLRGKADHVADITDGNAPAHGEETGVYSDGGCQGADKRPDAKPDVRRSIAIRPGKRREFLKFFIERVVIDDWPSGVPRNTFQLPSESDTDYKNRERVRLMAAVEARTRIEWRDA